MINEILIVGLSSTAATLAALHHQTKRYLAQSDAQIQRCRSINDRLASRLTDLDAANCQLLTRIAKFEPKHGADGRFTTKRGTK